MVAQLLGLLAWTYIRQTVRLINHCREIYCRKDFFQSLNSYAAPSLVIHKKSCPRIIPSRKLPPKEYRADREILYHYHPLGERLVLHILWHTMQTEISQLLPVIFQDTQRIKLVESFSGAEGKPCTEQKVGNSKHFFLLNLPPKCEAINPQKALSIFQKYDHIGWMPSKLSKITAGHQRHDYVVETSDLFMSPTP